MYLASDYEEVFCVVQRYYINVIAWNDHNLRPLVLLGQRV